VVLEPGNASARLADLLAGHDRRAVAGSPAYERARYSPAAHATLDRLVEADPVMTATSLCICGHEAAEHANPADGDIRCLVVGERAELEHVFDDGQDNAHDYRACLRFMPADEKPPQRA
jgi:hypothetical protein